MGVQDVCLDFTEIEQNPPSEQFNRIVSWIPLQEYEEQNEDTKHARYDFPL